MQPTPWAPIPPHPLPPQSRRPCRVGSSQNLSCRAVQQSQGCSDAGFPRDHWARHSDVLAPGTAPAMDGWIDEKTNGWINRWMDAIYRATPPSAGLAHQAWLLFRSSSLRGTWVGLLWARGAGGWTSLAVPSLVEHRTLVVSDVGGFLHPSVSTVSVWTGSVTGTTGDPSPQTPVGRLQVAPGPRNAHHSQGSHAQLGPGPAP